MKTITQLWSKTSRNVRLKAVCYPTLSVKNRPVSPHKDKLWRPVSIYLCLFFLFTQSKMTFLEDHVHNRSKIFHLRMSKWQKWKTFGENFYFYRCSSFKSTWRGVEMFIFWKGILWGLHIETFVKFQRGSFK